MLEFHFRIEADLFVAAFVEHVNEITGIVEGSNVLMVHSVHHRHRLGEGIE